MQIERLELEQGSKEWHTLRKTKITSTDAAVIMGVSPWKTKSQLYKEKKSQETNTFVNEVMQRGIDLEPIARDLYIYRTGIHVKPAVVVKHWAMASLDGISDCDRFIVEIKCPGDKTHEIATNGKIPDYYYPQLQHQMYVCDLNEIDYFSFDGFSGEIVKVKRDEEYITKMIEKELEFYQCLVNNTPPMDDENNYIQRNDELWKHYAEMYVNLSNQMSDLQQKLDECKNEIIALSKESNCKGYGISVCQINKKGNVDYSKIPELKDIDLEKYRKKPSFFWKINKINDNDIFAA